MKKTMKTIAVATVLGITASTFNPASATLPTTFTTTAVTVEAASTVSIKEAAQKIAEAEKKAYNQKKNVTVSVSVSCPSKKKVWDITHEVIDEVAGVEIGVEDMKAVTKFGIEPAFNDIDSWGAGSAPKIGGASFSGKVTLSGKSLTVKITIKNTKKFRTNYYENWCLGQNLAEIQGRVAGMSEKDKAWTVGQWVAERMHYLYTKSDAKWRTDSKLYEGKANGKCDGLAWVYKRYACLTGLDAAYVASEKDNHAWNAVRIDGEIYCLDMQGVDDYTNCYEALLKDSSRTWVSALSEMKGWTGEDSIGEYCLVTSQEMYDISNDCGSGLAKPSSWDYYWAF